MKEKLQQLVTLVEEIPALKDSIIKELFQIMLSGEEPVIEEELKPGEEVIGEMNDLEKGLMVLCNQYADIEKSLVDQLRSAFENDEEIKKPDEFKKMETKLEKTRGRFKVLRKFLWKSIQENNPNVDKNNACGLVARSGFKIATMPRKSSADDLVDILKKEEGAIHSMAEFIEGMMMKGGPTGAGMQIPGIHIRVL